MRKAGDAAVVAVLATLVWTAGCGSVVTLDEDATAEPPSDAAAQHDAAPTDELAPPDSSGVISGSGRMSGPTYRLELEIGHPTGQPTVTTDGADGASEADDDKRTQP